MVHRKFFAELKRRNVIRFAGLCLVGAWLLVQVTGTDCAIASRITMLRGSQSGAPNIGRSLNMKRPGN